jgi:flagellar basal-body rod protein FlgG
MPRALWTGASGMSAQQTNVDLIANNIANVNTVGFKRQRSDFQDLFYDIVQAPGSRATNAGQNSAGTQLGLGVKLNGTPRIFTEGNLEVTQVQTDLAIEGDGFFEVTLPDGSSSYTRAGNFRVDADGSLVTPDGLYLVPRITIPDGTTAITVAPTGEVTVTQNNTQSAVGTITLARFRNPAGLLSIGRNLFLQSEASGNAQTGTPAQSGFGALRQGALEKSNVEVVTELVGLIIAQRAYETNSKSVKTADEMMSTANELIR